MKALLSGMPQLLSGNPLYAGLIDFHGAPWLFLAFLVLVLVLKLFATPLTTAGGGIGGIFAPSLFLGCFLGWAMALAVNLTGLPNLLGIRMLSTQNMALVGMAGVMAGVVHAPLTSIILIAEITGGYDLLIPLIITSTISHYTIRRYEKHSVYTRKLASSGELITAQKDSSALGLLHLEHFIRNDAPVIGPATTLAGIIELIRQTTGEFLVVADQTRFFGFIFVDNIRQVIFVPESHQLVCAQDLIEAPGCSIRPDQPMSAVLDAFDCLGEHNPPVASGSDMLQYLPVLDERDSYLGYVCQSEILAAYRQKIQDMSGNPDAED
jgi:CIC family chloride channel protein